MVTQIKAKPPPLGSSPPAARASHCHGFWNVSWDFEWELVRYYARGQIAFVVVAGKPVLASGQPTEWDARAFVRSYRELGRRIGSAPGIERVHGSSKGYRPERATPLRGNEEKT